MLPQDLLVKLVELWNDGTTLVKFATLILLLTQFAKPILIGLFKLFGRELKIEGDAARYLSLIVQTIVWALYVFVQARGAESQFTDAANIIQGILTALVPVLPAAVVANLASSAGYNYLSDKKAPGFQSVAK